MDLRSHSGCGDDSLMSRRSKGFTLLEVLIALAIFAMAAVVLGASYVNVLMAYEAANKALDRNENLEFARAALMAEAEREEVEKGGTFDAGGGLQVRWKAEVESTSTPDVYEVLFDCEMSGRDLKKPDRVVQRFRLLRPTWAKDDERNKVRAKTHERINKLLMSQKKS